MFESINVVDRLELLRCNMYLEELLEQHAMRQMYHKLVRKGKGKSNVKDRNKEREREREREKERRRES